MGSGVATDAAVLLPETVPAVEAVLLVVEPALVAAAVGLAAGLAWLAPDGKVV